MGSLRAALGGDEHGGGEKAGLLLSLTESSSSEGRTLGLDVSRVEMASYLSIYFSFSPQKGDFIPLLLWHFKLFFPPLFHKEKPKHSPSVSP